MTNMEQLLFWMNAGAVALVVLVAFRIGLYGLRALRAGVPGLKVSVSLTAAVIGFLLSLGASLAGSIAAFRMVARTDASPVALLAIQVAAALGASWVAVAIYGRWCAPAVIAWFSREGASRRG